MYNLEIVCQLCTGRLLSLCDVQSVRQACRRAELKPRT